MRRYDDPVEVRRGWIGAPAGDSEIVGGGSELGRATGGRSELGQEGPEQFLWHGRLWKVRAVIAHWVETGAWWQGARAQAVIGSADGEFDRGPADLLGERELWRVEAGQGHDAGGVFDLAFDWSDGRWQLVGCHD